MRMNERAGRVTPSQLESRRNLMIRFINLIFTVGYCIIAGWTHLSGVAVRSIVDPDREMAKNRKLLD